MEDSGIPTAVVAGLVLIVFAFCAFVIVRHDASTKRGAADIRTAYALLDAGKVADSLPLFAAAFREVLDDQQRVNAFANRGWANIVLGHERDAIRDFTTALKLRPNYIFCLVNRGLAWHRLGRFDEALADYNRGLALAPNAVDALQNRAMIYAHRGQWPEAIADLTAAIRWVPTNAQFHVRLAALFFREGDLEAARKELAEATKIAPENAQAYWLLAKIFTQGNHPARGLAAVEAALASRPKSASLHLARALILIDAQRPDLALADLDFTLNLVPADGMALASRGLAQMQLGKYEEALGDAKEGARVAPALPFPYYVLGLIFDAEWREEEAIANYDRAIACDSEFAAPVAWRGLAEAHAGDYERARTDLEEAVKRFPGDNVTHQVRAIFLASCPDARFRDGPTALVEAELAAELAPHNPETMDTLAMAYAEVGNFGSAIATEAAALERTSMVSVMRRELQRRLHGYEQHKPYRDFR